MSPASNRKLSCNTIIFLVIPSPFISYHHISPLIRSKHIRSFPYRYLPQSSLSPALSCFCLISNGPLVIRFYNSIVYSLEAEAVLPLHSPPPSPQHSSVIFYECNHCDGLSEPVAQHQFSAHSARVK